jgi:hypothetical protein
MRFSHRTQEPEEPAAMSRNHIYSGYSGHPNPPGLFSQFVLNSARAVVVVFTILLLNHPFAHAQFDSASVLGTINDPTGASVPSATVRLLDSTKNVSVTRQTDGNGNYEFTNVLPGDYSITVTASGFETSQTDRFTVTVGARQRVSLVLKLGGNTQTVTVSGAASQLEIDTSDRGETVQSRETVNLPLNGRSYADLSTLVPGVRESLLEVLSLPSRDASYNVNGLNSMVNNFQLDGIDNNAYRARTRAIQTRRSFLHPTLPRSSRSRPTTTAPSMAGLEAQSSMRLSAAERTSFTVLPTIISATRC